MCISILGFLFLCWDRCGLCDRPLRSWLVVFCMLQLVQIPARFVFFAKIKHAEAWGHSIEDIVRVYTASPAWKVSKNMSFFTYCWFVLGITWVVNARDCSDSMGVWSLTVLVIAQALARAVMALLCFRAFFPQLGTEGGDGKSAVTGATPEQIAALGHA